MIVWFLLILFILVLRLIMGSLKDKKKQKYFLTISGIAITLIMGLRFPKYKIVYDLSGYYNYYKTIITTPWDSIFSVSRFEPGYALLNKILATFVPWPQFILLAEAGVCVFCICRFIYKNSEHPFQAIIFYITLGTMTFQLTGFRQAFAISICLLSTELIKEKKLFGFLISVLLAITFHKTAVVFLPLYFIANRKPNLKNNIISISSIVVLALLADYFTKFGNELFDTEFSGYIGNSMGGYIPVIVYLTVIALALFNYKKIKNNIPINMTFLGLAIYLMRYTTLALERISFFYAPSLIVQLPNAINSYKDQKFKLILNYFSIVLAILLFFYRMQNAVYADYRFFWQ